MKQTIVFFVVIMLGFIPKTVKAQTRADTAIENGDTLAFYSRVLCMEYGEASLEEGMNNKYVFFDRVYKKMSAADLLVLERTLRSRQESENHHYLIDRKEMMDAIKTRKNFLLKKQKQKKDKAKYKLLKEFFRRKPRKHLFGL